MKVVLDCNVLVSAARTDGVCRAVVIETVRRHEIVLSSAILAEYREVAERPKHGPWRDALLSLIDLLARVAFKVEPEENEFDLPDPDDEAYLAAAEAGPAAALVTGNARHFPAGRYGKVAILTPREFLDRFAGTR
ncbi:MAG: putative toxin-antitoxin system toxin component, PIN family [Magnetospirillum sp. WYHS-4]